MLTNALHRYVMIILAVAMLKYVRIILDPALPYNLFLYMTTLAWERCSNPHSTFYGTVWNMYKNARWTCTMTYMTHTHTHAYMKITALWQSLLSTWQMCQLSFQYIWNTHFSLLIMTHLGLRWVVWFDQKHLRNVDNINILLDMIMDVAHIVHNIPLETCVSTDDISKNQFRILSDDKHFQTTCTFIP